MKLTSPNPIRWIFTILVCVLLSASWVVSPARAQAGESPDLAQSANLDQCRNGTLAAPAECRDVPAQPGGLGWVNGNANGLQAHWAEGQSIAYRIRFTGLPAGTHTVLLEYDFTAPSGKHAIDYLTSYNRTETTADACTGVLTAAECANLDQLFSIPVDPVLATCKTPQHDPLVDGGVPQLPGVFYMYNGAVTGASYVGTHLCEGDAIKVQMLVTFNIPSGSSGNAVLAWGGHIAAEFDWGRTFSAHNIPGSPYHMNLLKLDNAPTGSQDRSLMTSAIYATELLTKIQTDGTPHVDKPFADLATLTGYLGSSVSINPVIAGTLNFYVCADTTVPYEAPFSIGCDSSQGTFVGSVPVNGNSTYLSPQYTPTSYGYYCFSAEFVPADGAVYPYARESNTLTVGDYAECALITAPTALTLTSFETNPLSGGLIYSVIGLSLLMLALHLLMDFRRQHQG